ncbi:hypothetical protein PIB30_046229 [Stylosanthes scabra]|uniref:Uncharacterized protein n=1 Tax=Stylosanthes scabra TaxID=79078 RepID=A0ABU6SGE3_9FABA|nr:hypothetical protein [Stylosanthes scabra]
MTFSSLVIKAPGVTTAQHNPTLVLAIGLEVSELVLAVGSKDLPHTSSSSTSNEFPTHPNPHREYTVLLGALGTSHHWAVLECVGALICLLVDFRLIGIEKRIRKAKEGIEEQKVHKRKPKSEKRGTVRSHGPIVRPHVSLGAFRDAFCQYPRDPKVPSHDRAGAKSKLQSLFTVRLHRVPRDHTILSGRIKSRLKMEFQIYGPGPKPLQGPIRPI